MKESSCLPMCILFRALSLVCYALNFSWSRQPNLLEQWVVVTELPSSKLNTASMVSVIERIGIFSFFGIIQHYESISTLHAPTLPTSLLFTILSSSSTGEERRK